MANVFQLNSSRISLREYAFGTPLLLMPLAWAIKAFGINIASSTDDPAVDSLDEFVTDRPFPANIEAKLAPELQTLETLGFRQQVRHELMLSTHNTTIYRVTMLHETGKYVARVQYRIWRQPAQTLDFLTRQIETPLADGSTLITFGGKPDMLAPENFFIERCGPKKTLEQLWDRHQARLAENMRAIRELYSREDLIHYIHQQHEQLIAFHVERGVFDRPTPLYGVGSSSPPTNGEDPEEIRELAPLEESPEYRDVFAELDKLEKNQSSIVSSILMLVISFGLFAAAIGWQQDWTALLLLAPVLLFHEAGHFLAMKLFGYRDTKMFFIPFFGAAVSGRHLNVAGWKKGIVSMAGPVPGIVVGGAIGIWGLLQPADWKFQLAFAALLINGLNMLPILPLDGGAFWQAILFCRHRFLDVAFRGAAIGMLALITLGTGSYVFGFIAIAMGMALPVAYRIAAAVERLRGEGFAAVSPDGKSIPREEAITVIDDVQANFPEPLHPKIVAQNVYSIFESLNAKAPGALVTIAMGMFYFGSLFMCLVLTAVIFIGRDANLSDFFNMAAAQPTTVYDADSQRQTETAPLAADAKPVTITTHFADQAIADAEYDKLSKSEHPLRVQQIGPTLFVTTAAGEAVDNVTEQLKAAGGEPFPSSTEGAVLRVMTIAVTSNGAEEMLEDVRSYQAFPAFLQIMPPWDPAWDAATDEQRRQWKEARQQYQELQVIQFTDPETLQMQAEMSEVILEEGTEKLEELLEKLDAHQAGQRPKVVAERLASVEEPAMRNLLAAHFAHAEAMIEREEDFFPELIDGESPRQMQPEEERLIEAAAILGQVAEPQEFDWNNPPMTYIYGETTGLLLLLEADTRHPEKLLTQLADWFERHDCADTKYDVLPWNHWDEF
ncbi:site-2 protease family protein [Blastopirellula retiformator]|uniref:Peptidase family M50 n=1 Tax=Blastopirellula retiformator TaxID=2527970 RepID=A0A5C5VIX8_9BACT|nr:site-2 protease family protein [Blastopirellula retiformator]TWT38594.1 Peptidase family M50 [Blastopirellula retiformator]